MPPTLSKHDALGLALQTAFGTPNMNITWVPITREPDFELVENFEVLEAGDMSDWQFLSWTKGQHYTGSLGFAPIPGLMSTFANWVLSRDAYNQPKYATIGVYDSGVGCYAIQDVVVATAEWTFAKGQPVAQVITAHGRKKAATSPTPPTPSDVARGLPYLCSEISVQVDFGTGYAASYDFEEITLRVETQAEDPDAGYRLSGEPYPHVLYTTGGIRVTGTATRDYVSNAFAQRVDQMLAAPYNYDLRIGVKITATRGTSSCTWEIPYAQIMNYSAPFAANSNTRRTERIEFRGFTDETGTDAPLVMTVA